MTENKPKPYFTTELGKFYLKTTFMWYDGPMLFSATNETGELYLVTKVDEHIGPKVDGYYTGRDDWLAVPITPERLKLFETSTLDMRDTFRNAEGGRGIWIECVWRVGDTARWVELSELEDDLYCKEGVFLSKTVEDGKITWGK